ncbi:MAG: SEL1-like repeat protein [Treponema sp.]|jgi:hypothetical protein|nr:SEL1-like repeat protein [Treponema sp.]
MRLTYLWFSYENTAIPWPYKEIAQYNDYCKWLGIMYKFYLKPVITDKMRKLCVIVTDDMNHIKKPTFSDGFTPENDIYLYTLYDYRNFQNMPVKDVQRTLLDLIQKRIMEYAVPNNIEENIFEEVYNKIIENDFLFEGRYMEPVSNNVYTAQMSFKFDYQNNGAGNDMFVEIYKDNRLINKIKFCGIGWRAARGYIKYIEWIDENNLRMDNLNDGFLYWKISIDGTVELDSFQKSYNHNVFRLGLCYYYGKEIAGNKEKGLELIEKAAGMGCKSANEWLVYPQWRKIWWG